jgi:PilZ domain-containing protein
LPIFLEMREKRSEVRVNVMARVVVVWMDETGTEHISQGKLEDLSDGGISIRVNEQIDVGSNLTARTPLGNFSGTVVRSRQQGQEYVLGIKRDAPQR